MSKRLQKQMRIRRWRAEKKLGMAIWRDRWESRKKQEKEHDKRTHQVGK
jgi:hypothetical protein